MILRPYIALSAFLAASVMGCAAETSESDTSGTSADELRSPEECRAASTVEVEIAAPIEAVFDYVVLRETPAADLRTYGPVPGVKGDEILTSGGWDHEGARREVLFEDGSTAHEQIDLIDRPHRFGYHVNDFSSAVRFLASEGRGYWTFDPTDDDHTRVSWTYTFTPRSCLVAPGLRTFVNAFFHPYMQRGMDSIEQHILSGKPRR